MPLLLFFIPAGVLLWLYSRNAAAIAASNPLQLAPSQLDVAGFALPLQFAITGDDEGNPLGASGQGLQLGGVAPIAAPDIDALIGRVLAGSSTSAGASWWRMPATLNASTYAEPIARAEQNYGIPQNLLARLIQEESAFNPRAVGPITSNGQRAQGIAQFMPATARDLGIDPMQPGAAIDGAGRYLAKLFAMTGSWAHALAAYNWGIGNVQRRGLDAAPAETQRYVTRILADVPA